MIQALLIDWGGVLMRTVDIRPRLAWERRLGLPPTGLADLVFGGPAWDRAQHGRATLAQTWDAIAGQLQLTEAQASALSRDFWAGDQLDTDLIALVRSLRDQGLRVALVSNHAADFQQQLPQLGLDGLFDTTLISALEGVAKPDPVIYRRALERLAVEPSEAAFVDDLWANVEAARRLGMTGIRFRGPRHLRRALAQAGLPMEVAPLAPVDGIRAVIFDWGGVISPLTFIHHTREWEERLGLAQGKLNRVLWGTEWKKLETGAITQGVFDDYVAHGLGLPDPEAVRAFYDEYFGEDIVDQTVMAAVRSLRGRYRVAMLTNAFPGHAEMAQRRFDLDVRSEFDLYVNSAEVGLAKPDPAIFQFVLDRLEVAAGEAVLLDDMVRNTDGAGMLGLHAIVFAEPETGLADLEQLLGQPIVAERADHS